MSVFGSYLLAVEKRIKEIDEEIKAETRRRELRKGSIDVEYRRIE